MKTMMGAANPLTMMNNLADKNMALWNMFTPGTKTEETNEK
jgi:hypothetical protein